MTKDLIKYLSEFTTPDRAQLFHRIANERTRYVTVAIENIYQSHNASAVLRTCDCFGVQDVHIIENEYEYTINPDIALGSSNWLHIHRYNKEGNNTEEALIMLKKKGYRIVATTPHTNDVTLDEFDIEKGKFALLFGTELDGLTDKALNMADEFLKIPMYGFTESFNISVSAALILHRLTSKIRQSAIDYRLTENEHDELVLEWLKLSIKKSNLIVDRYLKTHK
jgi:tRNA (guanosine-2'-O-)-methyltransferase